MGEWLRSFASIVLLDLILSGDNAMVIGLACRELPMALRRKAMVVATLAAVLLRVVCTGFSAWMLQVPLLEAAGAVALCWIAWRLVRPAESEAAVASETRTQTSFGSVVRMVVTADLVMSLDNMLAVGGVAHGNLGLLLLGLGISIPLVLAGSGLVIWLADHAPWLTWVGAGVLAWTAGHMVGEDRLVSAWLPVLHHSPLLPAAVVALFLVALLLRGIRRPLPSGGQVR